VGGRWGAIPDKPERVLSVTRASHVGAEEWHRWALFLRVPGGATTGEIGGVNVLRAALLKVLIKGGQVVLMCSSGSLQSSR